MNNSAIIAEFKRRFEEIKAKGFVKSHRSNNTGIGKTFEDLMGVAENNLQDVDFMGLIEIKTNRGNSPSMLTMFTQAPDNPKGANSMLHQKYGIPDKEFPELKALHTTISGDDYNSYDNRKYGFKLVCDDGKKEVFISIRDNQTGKIIEQDVSYKYETLKDRLEHKCSLIAYVDAETKIKDNIEYFHFTNVRLLSVKSFEKFLECIKNGRVKFDFRIGSYKSGDNKGKYHDHGSGFRIHKDDIPYLFEITDLK